MPEQARRYQGKHRSRRREARRAGTQFRRSDSITTPSIPSGIATPPAQPAPPMPSPQKAQSKVSPERLVNVTTIKDLKRIGIIAGSMFLILFILSFILK